MLEEEQELTIKDLLTTPQHPNLSILPHGPVPHFAARNVLVNTSLDIDAEDLRDLRFAQHFLGNQWREMLAQFRLDIIY